MAGSSLSRFGALALAALLLQPTVLVAQSRTAGRVVRVAQGDTVPVARVSVVLHRVSRASQGPIDTTRTDSQGRFALRFATDTSAAYLLSVRYAGIEYFSSPIASNPALPDTAVTIIVADTSSSAPVTAGERTLLISRADETATRAVVDWVVLRNGGPLTRIAGDSAHPSWAAPLPLDAQNVELADAAMSQFSPEALEFRRDSVLVFAPLSPGQKELILQYRIPGGPVRFEVPLTPGLDSIFVMLEDPGARVVTPALPATTTQSLQGRSFRRWAGRPATASVLAIEFAGQGISTGLVLPLLVAIAALGFLGLGWFRVRRRYRGAPVHPISLADQIARLDAEHLARAGTLDPAGEAHYQSERARLRRELDAALAMTRPRS